MGLLDDLTGGKPPKMASKKEVFQGEPGHAGVMGRLRQGGMTQQKVEKLKNYATGFMDADNPRHPGRSGMGAKELDEYISVLKKDKNFSEKERAKVYEQFKKEMND